MESPTTHQSLVSSHGLSEEKLIKAEFRQPRLYFQSVLRFVRIKDPIVSYLRELGSAEGSVADTRDKKRWKSSSLHSRDLKAHKQLKCNRSIKTHLLMILMTKYLHIYLI